MSPDRPDFSFALLETEVAKYSPDAPLIETVGREKWFWLAGLSGAAIAMLAVMYPALPARPWLMVGGLAAEIVGFVSALTIQFRRDWKNFRIRRAAFASEMDEDNRRYRQLISWLRGYPSSILRDALVYARRRSASMKRRLGLLSGGVERLGILPLVAALFLQARSFSWSGRVNTLELIVASVLVILYVLSWWSVVTTLRLDVYEAMLADALGEQG
jgi:hypothetical protein